MTSVGLFYLLRHQKRWTRILKILKEQNSLGKAHGIAWFSWLLIRSLINSTNNTNVLRLEQDVQL